MNQDDFNNLWHYYLVLDEDLLNTARFVEPVQKDVYSFEFQKIIILACCEVEAAFKDICSSVSKGKTSPDNMGKYKESILQHFPNITSVSVVIGRTGQSIQPFRNWDIGKLIWWDDYQLIKHNRTNSFRKATYDNALFSLAALYVLILYIKELCNLHEAFGDAKYISSDYISQPLHVRQPLELLDFENHSQNRK